MDFTLNTTSQAFLDQMETFIDTNIAQAVGLILGVWEIIVPIMLGLAALYFGIRYFKRHARAK